MSMPQIAGEVRNQMCRIRDLVRLAPVDEHVILNDVGCTLFYIDNPVVDLFGLTSFEVRVQGGRDKISKQAIEKIAVRHGAKMAIIYPAWFADRIPASWIEIGRWTTPPKNMQINRGLRYTRLQHSREPKLLLGGRCFEVNRLMQALPTKMRFSRTTYSDGPHSARRVDIIKGNVNQPVRTNRQPLPISLKKFREGRWHFIWSPAGRVSSDRISPGF